MDKPPPSNENKTPPPQDPPPKPPAPVYYAYLNAVRRHESAMERIRSRSPAKKTSSDEDEPN